ncbi:MAG: hypothetical protein AB2535_09965 [Candidatus Thiodiazotropha endolucinida]
MNNIASLTENRSQTASLVINKVIRNTYNLLSMTLFVSIFNLFTSLLHLLGFMSSDE